MGISRSSDCEVSGVILQSKEIVRWLTLISQICLKYNEIDISLKNFQKIVRGLF